MPLRNHAAPDPDVALARRYRNTAFPYGRITTTGAGATTATRGP
jgi:hypothetical protein